MVVVVVVVVNPIDEAGGIVFSDVHLPVHVYAYVPVCVHILAQAFPTGLPSTSSSLL